MSNFNVLIINYYTHNNYYVQGVADLNLFISATSVALVAEMSLYTQLALASEI